jgi:hypothetical protein
MDSLAQSGGMAVLRRVRSSGRSSGCFVRSTAWQCGAEQQESRTILNRLDPTQNELRTSDFITITMDLTRIYWRYVMKK